MYFAIRDDDTCFFTKPEDLERAYDFIDEGCVSLSIVPFTVPTHTNNVLPYGEGFVYRYYDISQNTKLIEYLKRGYKEKKYDFLLHGYSHEYKKKNGQWVPEMIWKSKDQLKKEISMGKKHLEEILGTPITIFVAPNNAIDQRGIAVIENLGMNYSGIIQIFNRKFDIKSFFNFTKRWICRFTLKIPYPGILDYGKHKELVAYTLDDYSRLIKEYSECKKRRQPFTLYTHYWNINKNPAEKELLKKIYKYVTDDGAELVSLTECFDKSGV